MGPNGMMCPGHPLGDLASLAGSTMNDWHAAGYSAVISTLHERWALYTAVYRYSQSL